MAWHALRLRGPRLLAPSEGRRAWWRKLLSALLLAACAFGLYNANLRAISAADTFAARYLPFSILRNHTVTLDPILETMAQGRRYTQVLGENASAFWITRGLSGHYVSTYPIVVPVVVAPLYWPALAYLDAHGWDRPLFDQVARVMEKLVASLIAATSVGLLFVLLRRRCAPRPAAALSLLYALGTNTWTISSQALWAHGLAQCLIVVTLLLLTARPSALRAVLAGLCCATLAATRQPDSILAGAMGLYGLWWAGRRRWLLIAAGLVPVALLLAYNLLIVGHVAGAYALVIRPQNYNDDIAEGIAGLLFSPTRGLFVFTPFLLFVPVLFRRALREPGTRALTLTLAAAMAAQVGFYALADWRQGVSWGPRWLTDILPLLMWMLPPILAGLARPARVVFAAAAAVAIVIQAIGAFWYVGATDATVMVQGGKDRTAPLWQLRNAAFITELAHPLAPRDLLHRVRGNIDLIEVIDVVGTDARGGEVVGREIDVAGWSLVDSRSPGGVTILVDGRVVGGTNEFFTRPDVVQTLGESSPAGWRLRVPVAGLAAGPHQLAALVGTDNGAEPRLLRQVGFQLPADSPGQQAARLLARSARLATERLAAHQQAPGYWLTAFTGSTAFAQPRPEMNTYLNAVMLDVAGPAAASLPLAGMLDRARAFLASQVEDDGLVRYHGRPDSPTIGVLGCAITPDADDTALVWRVAPPEDSGRQVAALETVQRYRRPDGLYQTWLAARDDYRCLDHGRDPNPADIAIQMHVYLWLAQADPPAAQALCEALRHRAGDDDLWVYYALAPPMVILRLADLRHAGCDLALPAARRQPAVPAQAPWLRVAEQLRLIAVGETGPDTPAGTAALLREIAAGDFALMQQAPPLLYHNDMTATVRRFYWSEDLGYALWLRLYHEWQRIAGPEG